jgi:nucleotide-binding universal stress UspA family protein
MKILLAVDGSPFSDAAVDAVAQRPWPEGSEVDLLSVFEPPSLPTTESWALPEQYYDEMDRAAELEAKAATERASKRLRAGPSKLQITSDVVRGNPVHIILDRAERWGSDLIVVGSHGYRGFTKLLLGSVSQAVASHAKCSVEIVRKSRNGDTKEQH